MSFINLRTSESREDVSRWLIAALCTFIINMSAHLPMQVLQKSINNKYLASECYLRKTPPR